MDWSPFLPAWGGVNLELLTRIDALERETEQIRSQKASENAFGIAKLTNAQDVTDANSGLALSAMQNNAGIEGTIANRLAQIRSEINVVDITSRCSSAYNIITELDSPTILDIPALNLIIGAFYIMGDVGNQTAVLNIPYQCAKAGACGIGRTQESGVNVVARTSGNLILSSHSVNTSVSNPFYMFFVHYK